MSERICHSPHTLQFQQQKFTAGFRVCGTPCCRTSDRTWTVDISSNHWKFMCLVFRPNGPRHIVTNCFSVHYMKLTLYWACEYVTSTHWCCGCVVACLVSMRHHKQFKRQSLWSRAVLLADSDNLLHTWLSPQNWFTCATLHCLLTLFSSLWAVCLPLGVTQSVDEQTLSLFTE